MPTPDQQRVLAQTSHLRLIEKAGWAYVQRTGSTGVVCVIAVTAEDRLLLVEQVRPPVGRRVVELPAGLAGDLPFSEQEPLATAAGRELLEETGYQAAELTELTAAPSSAGLTDEIVTFYVADNVRKVHAGGGDDSEQIDVHEVPLSDVDRWLRDAEAERGCLVDAKLYSGLYLLDRHRKAAHREHRS